MGFWEKSLRVFKCLCENGRQGVRRIAQQTGLSKKQHLDNLRRKDSLSGAATAEISVRLGNYSASYFAGAAKSSVHRLTQAMARRGVHPESGSAT
jgi:hypothetical protein